MTVCIARRLSHAIVAATLAGFTPLAMAQGAPPANAAPAAAASTANTNPSAANAAPASVSADESSYSVGLVFGNQLYGAGLGQAMSLDALVRGMKDGLAGKVLSPEDREHAMQLVRSGRDALAARNHAAAKEYLEKNASAPGVVSTASGLQYQIIDAGNAKAASPVPTDRVTVHYRGRLIDGTEFDSSDAHAQAATFGVGAVIKGWREALQLMKPGSKWRLFVPPELGYDLNAPPTIPPGSLLIFDIELLKVEPAPVMSPEAAKARKGVKPAAKPAARAN